MARLPRRAVALSVDWLLSWLIAHAFLRSWGWGTWAPLVVLLVMHVLLVATTGTSIGHRLAGLRVERVGHTAPGPVRALTRGALLCLAIPPLVWDQDGRGLHDRLAGTVIVRS